MQFDFQPVLRNDIIELRPLREEDFDALFAVASDPLLWEQHPARNRHEPEVFEALFRESLASGGALVAIDPMTRRVIGSSRFLGYDEAKREVEIGYTFLARAYWGGTYNRAMKHLMLEHAFRFVESVLFRVGPHNIRSQRAMEKIGGVPLGMRIDSSGKESVVFQITAAKFTRQLNLDQ